MDGWFIPVLIVLVILKLIFWTCFFVYRARHRQVILVRRTCLSIQADALPSHNDRAGIVGQEVPPATEEPYLPRPGGTGQWQGAAGPWQGPPRPQHGGAGPQSKMDMPGNSMAAGGFNTSRPPHQMAGPPPPYTPRQEPEHPSKPM